ncbi:MAG: right-handed parallel beta-helix repeat-containing protein [Bacteroidales bacterium]
MLKNCVFEWDNGIYDTGSIYAIAQLYLWDASGVTIKGCDFLNNADDGISISYRGIGILSDYLTDFNVSGRCTDPFCSNFDRNTFSKLTYGIISNGGNDVLIDRCDFIDNYGAAEIISSESLQFTRNDLNVYDYEEEPSLDYESFGLYLEGCTGYQVEENDFHDGLLGLVVYNSGQYTNEIYLNDFYNLNGNGVATGAIGIGINSGTRSPSGLHFNCNDFNQTDYAIGVTGGHLVTADSSFIYVSSSSISNVQGRSLITGTYKSADNTFWLHGMSDQNDFYVDANVSLYNQYRYNGAYDNLADRDANINSFDNNLVSKYYYGTFSTREQECPSNLEGGGGVIPIPLMVQNLNDEEEEILTLEQEYSDLTSGVNVNELTHLANISTSNNTQGVHNALMSASPYLTDTILNTYLMNENANEISRANVMLANSPLPSNVLENIEKSNLSTDIKHYIMANQVGVNILEKIETDIQSAKASKQFITDRLHLKYMHSDSTVLIQEWVNMLETKNDIHSKEKLLNVYFSKGEFAAAENLLANLETELLFSNDSEKLRQIKVKQIELSMRQNGSDHDLNQSDLNYLFTIAEDYKINQVVKHVHY